MMNRKQYLLMILAEELGELAHHAFKASRFGPGDENPKLKQTNIEGMRQEYADVKAMINMLEDESIFLEPRTVDEKSECLLRIKRKIDKVEELMVYSVAKGCLDPDALKKPQTLYRR